MFRWFSPRPRVLRPRSVVFQHRARLLVEPLEVRNLCSASPVLTLSAVPLTSTSLQINGSVQDANPSGVQISYKGAASGSTTTDSNGNFAITLTNLVVGRPLSFIGLDSQQLQTNAATTILEDPASNLMIAVNTGPSNAVTVNGQLSGSNSGGQTITFGGTLVASTVTNSNGAFTYSGTSSGTGMMTITAPNGTGTTTENLLPTIPAAPKIVQFVAQSGPNNVWTFSGNVSSKDVWGSWVTLTMPSGQTETCLCDGTGKFSCNITLPANSSGIATAVATDAFDQNSGTAECTL